MTQSVRSTAACVDFITRARWRDVPPDAAELARRCIVDGLGVMLAGSTTDGSTILRDYVRRTDGGEESTVFGAEVFRASAGAAAFLNAASGHAMDWDDTQLSTTADRIFGLLTHPTIPPLAAALAVGRAAAGVRRTRARSVPHRLRSGMQDRRVDPSQSLQEGLSLIGHDRHVWRRGGCGEAPRPRREGDRRTCSRSPRASAPAFA